MNFLRNKSFGEYVAIFLVCGILFLIIGGFLFRTIAPEAAERIFATPTPSVLPTELKAIGEKLGELVLQAAFNNYLKDKLNDYDSSEYVSFTEPQKTNINGQEYWLSILKLRAKNPLGAYILKDVKMYIRHNEVVKAEGL